MKLRNNLILFFALIAIFSALFVNFIIIKSFSIVDTSFISKLDAVYFDQADFDEESFKEISSLINSGNAKVFRKLLLDVANPVSQFYGFAGFMKSNRSAAVEYIKSDILSSPKKVSIKVDNRRFNSTLGYAILLLLSRNQDWLSSSLTDDFLKATDSTMLNLYREGELITDSSYKNLLVSFIQDKYPSTAKNIINEFVSSKKISDMTLNEKKDVSFLLDIIDEEIKQDIILALLKEKDEVILRNTLNYITYDTNPMINEKLDEMIQVTTYSDNIKLLILDKYALTNKEKSLSRMVKFLLQNDKNPNLILKGLDIFEKYGDNSYWAFLTRYLGNQYDVNINNRVLNVITEISWKINPDNVYSTLLFTIRRSHYSTAIISINFYIDNSLTSNQSVILTRLRELENDEIKTTALRYIEHFSITSARDIIEKLSKDPNKDIQNKAIELAGKLSITLPAN